MLLEYGHSGLYTELLEMLGCARMPSRRVEHHLGELTRTFDAAVAAISFRPAFIARPSSGSPPPSRAEERDQRAGQVIRFLPKLWDTAEAIRRENPDIVEK
ncbi:hypothetical protein [Paenibacillus dendritiformis]|uniref:hypothetical protein n=1 Tax=Paenibacillus dendritiformis TaxID=130049 RepID=UPI000DAA6EB1|nr:hypothetical protein [Paenibacillus dendritiformis]PZM63557.1 hypothetical protein DOE73_21320 [Paenibacillus dendritiformis]